jgi:DNA-entry nuclease
MEAHSVEDGGKGISFNVFCYNAQPSIKINYKTGESYLMATTTAGTTNKSEDNKDATYILNTNSKKFHYPSCSSVNNMSSKNRKEYTGSRKNLSENGYSPCKICNP